MKYNTEYLGNGVYCAHNDTYNAYFKVDCVKVDSMGKPWLSDYSLNRESIHLPQDVLDNMIAQIEKDYVDTMVFNVPLT